jgi:hypothetical protein
MDSPRVVSGDEWLAARKELLAPRQQRQRRALVTHAAPPAPVRG